MISNCMGYVGVLLSANRICPYGFDIDLTARSILEHQNLNNIRLHMQLIVLKYQDRSYCYRNIAVDYSFWAQRIYSSCLRNFDSRTYDNNLGLHVSILCWRRLGWGNYRYYAAMHPRYVTAWLSRHRIHILPSSCLLTSMFLFEKIIGNAFSSLLHTTSNLLISTETYYHSPFSISKSSMLNSA